MDSTSAFTSSVQESFSTLKERRPGLSGCPRHQPCQAEPGPGGTIPCHAPNRERSAVGGSGAENIERSAIFLMLLYNITCDGDSVKLLLSSQDRGIVPALRSMDDRDPCTVSQQATIVSDCRVWQPASWQLHWRRSGDGGRCTVSTGPVLASCRRCVEAWVQHVFAAAGDACPARSICLGPTI